jgi:hypothetical protein
VCGIGQVLLGILVGIPGLILGVIALRQIRERGEKGRGMAIAGVVLGILGIVATILRILLVVASHTVNSSS